MIPALVAQEVRETILDYLRTTWSLSDRAAEAKLFEFLSGQAGDGSGGLNSNGIFRGPYLRVRLPFAPMPRDASVPLDIFPDRFQPHLHQLQAWQRLSTRDGAEPQPTLVTTGTGSGKTECFLYPLLDHCHRARQRGEGGIKAIVLYPMNALASDQARRFAEIIAGDKRLDGKLRVGMYIGGTGTNREMTPRDVIDKREILQKYPPDILLTNYRMLDLLLLRPKDQTLWKDNKPGTLRYLVLDELHTYDGAQGTDVACLIRRLTARLGGQDLLCPVGTSATVASDGGDGQNTLLEFASAVFDQPFTEESIVGEARRTPDDFFSLFQGETKEEYPVELDALEPAPSHDVESHTRQAASVWFPNAGSLNNAEPERFRLALGQTAVRHPLARAVIREASQSLLDELQLDERLCKRLPRFAGLSPEARQQLLTSMLTLLSWSQREVSESATPLLQIQVQLWVREVRRILRQVQAEPNFVWLDDHPDTNDRPALPMYYCRECGHSGWLAKWRNLGLSDQIVTDYAEIAHAARTSSEDLLYLHLDRHVAGDDGSPLLEQYFNRRTKRIEPKSDGTDDCVSIHCWSKVSQGAPKRDTRTCPACGEADVLAFLASRSASLSSVAVGHLFTTPLNTDRKLLAFNDSVQDASHRAGFYSGRTYRFSIRSGMLATVPDSGCIALQEIHGAMFDYWREHAGSRKDASPEAAMIAAFMPHDLEYLPEYREYITALEDRAQRQQEADDAGQDFDEEVPTPSDALMKALRQRMRWEVTREFGVASRIGRTLERSGAASVALEGERFEAALKLVVERVPNRLGTTSGVGEAAFRQFLVGMLNRLRIRGGIVDELLLGYVRSGGDGYQLSKKMAPLLSPFGQYTTRPIFFSNQTKQRFDCIAPSKQANWYSDWAQRSLGLTLGLGEVRELYAEVLPLLVRAGVLSKVENGAKQYWGIVPEALIVSREHAFRVCDTCGFEQPSISSSSTDPLGQACPRFRCDGTLAKRGSVQESRAQGYYRRFYERKALGRVWAGEHTGLLNRQERVDLEIAFKERPRPDAPNMLSCTPTLEMGIDIGDLSATMLCSVPPSTASYLQRVGRAGRSTGNALILTFASTQQHDLHFYDDPMAVMDGAIRPPGCYLDAPEVLKRQALAFCLDHFARGGGKIHGRVREMLSASEEDAFPKDFFAFVQERRQRLTDDFLELFGGQVLREESRSKLHAFMSGSEAGDSAMERRLNEQLDASRKRRDALRTLHKTASDRRRKLESDEAYAKTFDDPEQELQDLRVELGYLAAELKGLLNGDVWGWLCDVSLLPNYAFPEAGVQLQAFVRSEAPQADKGDSQSKEFVWYRAPSAAISELAPYNTFYGSGHKVQIDNVAVDRHKGEAAAEWQFCEQCHYAEPVAELSEEQQNCPACDAGGWQEKGRRRFLVKMDQVRAFTRQRDAVVSDETEDRERAFYELHNFYDVRGAAPKEAWSNESAGFGFELLPLVKLRRINFGETLPIATEQMLGGRPVADVEFVVCEDCGQVKPHASRAVRMRKKSNAHRGACPSRNKPEQKQPWRKVHLYRELQSEAIRLVLPVAKDDTVSRIANVRAALRLGLKEFYGGDPEHLGVDSYDEPTPEEGRRNFLLIQDMVPGGTGLLAELADSKGAKLKVVLEKARTAIETCPCRERTPAVKACYRCLYAYREQRHLTLLDREVAVPLIDKMLGAFENLKSVKTVGELQIASILESELEQRFRELLLSWNDNDGMEVQELENERLRLTLAGRTWRYEPQVTLAEDEVLHKCRPDFMLYPEGQEPEVLPVAGFADGAAYHIRGREPLGRIHDDFKKREGIVGSRKFVTWSFAWADIDAYSNADDLGDWAEGNVLANLERLLNGLGLAVGRVATADPMRALVGYLTAPLAWPKLAGCMAAAALHAAGKQAPEEAIREELRQLVQAEQPKLKLSDSVPGSNSLWTRMSFGDEGEVVALLSSDKDAARKLHKEPGAVRGVLRLADSQTERSKASYIRSWRMFLRAYNLLQFLPNVRVVTHEQLIGSAVEAMSDGTVSAVSTREATAALSKHAQSILDEIAHEAPDWVPVLSDVMSQGFTGVVQPLEVREGGHSGDIELGWREQRVGAYFDFQRQTAEYLTGQGWRLFKLEATISADDLLAALRGIG